MSVCSVSTAYTSLCRGLECLIKVWYIILVYPNVAEFSISNTVFCCRMEMEHPLIICVFWAFSYNIDDHSCLNCCTFIKHSQIMYVINVHILVCQHAKWDCMLLKFLWFDCVFWEFSYISDYLTRYIFIKLLQIVW